MEQRRFDVLIIGAGAAGMMAALELAMTGSRVGVIEAKAQTGGRMLTIKASGHWIEMGAEFVHGNLPLTKELLQKAGAGTKPVRGSIWQHKEGRLQEQEDFVEDYDVLERKLKAVGADKPVASFLETDLAGAEHEDLRQSLHHYVEGYYAADTTKASTTALCRELTQADEEQYRVAGGYQVMVDYLEQQCREKGVVFFLSSPVYQVHWKQHEALVVTGKEPLKAKRLLITVPVGTLQKETITFFPALPHIKKAVEVLGFGHVLKITLVLKRRFWNDDLLKNGSNLSDMSFLFSNEELPTWWSRYPDEAPVLTGWLGGPKAKAAQLFTNEEILEKGLRSLAKIFDVSNKHLRQLLSSAHFYNWSADDHFCGAYSYEVMGGEEAIEAMSQPVLDTLFFAGEGLQQGPQIGTVEGALQNGRQAAHRIAASF